MLFLLKMKPENDSGKWQRIDGTQPQRSCGNQSSSKEMLHRSHTAEHSVWAQIHVCRVTDLEKIPVQISKDEAPTPLPIVGPLFIPPLSFHLSRALLGVWRFGLFCCVYSSFHNRLDLIREPAFYWTFYFPNLSVFVSSYVKMKKLCSFQFNRLAISWPPWVRVWGWASDRFLPLTVFSLCLPFCFVFTMYE